MLDNAFTCSNGHSFRANAKIRARCPECGASTKRDFKAATEPKPKVAEPTDGDKTVVTEVVAAVVPKPVLLKQGKPRPMPVKKPAVAAAKTKPKTAKSNLIGSPKVASGLVKARRITSRGTMPVVKARPIKTAPARTVKEHGSSRGTRPFWHDVADKYGIGR